MQLETKVVNFSREVHPWDRMRTYPLHPTSSIAPAILVFKVGSFYYRSTLTFILLLRMKLMLAQKVTPDYSNIPYFSLATLCCSSPIQRPPLASLLTRNSVPRVLPSFTRYSKLIITLIEFAPAKM